MLCPCKSGKTYAHCCQPYHKSGAAPTPEALMRSRFSAYALSKVDYILQTAKEPNPRASILSFCTHTQFENLTILKVEPQHITFHAQLTQGGKDVSFTERSYFEQIEGKWIYVSGEIEKA